jgi:hypothetical protein
VLTELSNNSESKENKTLLSVKLSRPLLLHIIRLGFCDSSLNVYCVKAVDEKASPIEEFCFLSISYKNSKVIPFNSRLDKYIDHLIIRFTSATKNRNRIITRSQAFARLQYEMRDTKYQITYTDLSEITNHSTRNRHSRIGVTTVTEPGVTKPKMHKQVAL